MGNEKRQMTEAEKAEAIRILIERGRQWATSQPQVGLSNGTPKGGWTDKDRIK